MKSYLSRYPHYCSMVLARFEAFTGERAEKVRP